MGLILAGCAQQGTTGMGPAGSSSAASQTLLRIADGNKLAFFASTTTISRNASGVTVVEQGHSNQFSSSASIATESAARPQFVSCKVSNSCTQSGGGGSAIQSSGAVQSGGVDSDGNLSVDYTSNGDTISYSLAGSNGTVYDSGTWQSGIAGINTIMWGPGTFPSTGTVTISQNGSVIGTLKY